MATRLYFKQYRRMRREITFDRFVRIIGFLLGLVIVYVLLRKLEYVLIPFFVAWLVAYMLFPVVCFFQYRCRLRNRALSIVVTLLSLAVVLAVAAWLIIPPVVNETLRLKDIAVKYIELKASSDIIPASVQTFLRENIDLRRMSESITLQDISSFLQERVPQLISLLSTSLNALLGFLGSLMAIIYLFFILMDYEHMSHGVINLVPRGHRKFVQGIIKDVEMSMNAYFRGQSLIAFLVGILFATGFVIIGFPLAIPLGLFIGVLNLVPYLQCVGLIPTIILGLLKAHDTGDSVWIITLEVVAVFCIVQAIQDWFLTPRIMGKMTGLNAAVILLSLSIWGCLLGFVGLIIALPLTSLILSYYKRYVLKENQDLDSPDDKPGGEA